jgi:hypothetical protein
MNMNSYIKIFGPPLLKAVRELEKVAIEIPEVCIMDFVISSEISPGLAKDLGGNSVESHNLISDYFFNGTSTRIPVERCQTIISRTSISMGEYDFRFEWRKKPTMKEVEELITRIDAALSPLGVRYTITTK